jgi:hypothetical protein
MDELKLILTLYLLPSSSHVSQFAPCLIPYIKKKELKVEQLPQVYFLECKLRPTQLKHLTEEQTKRYEYALPYHFRPNQVIKEIKEENEGPIQMIYNIEGKRSAQFSFDPQEETLDEVVEDVCDEYELDEATYSEKLKKFIKEQQKNHSKKVNEQIEKKQKEIDAMSSEKVTGLNKLKILKFYPQNKTLSIDSFKVPFVNRYYGKANKIY